MQQAWSTGVSYFKEIRRFPMLKAEEELCVPRTLSALMR